MQLTGFLSKKQCETIHRHALQLLSEHGIAVESDVLIKRLEHAGGKTGSGNLVRFPVKVVEKHLAEAHKTPLTFEQPRIGAHVGIYQCRFHDPVSGKMLPFDEELLGKYIAFARRFKEIGYIGMLGLPFCPGKFPGNPQPLLEKLYAWKYGITPEGAVHDPGYCESLLNMFRCHAAATGKKISEVFCASGYMISPLKLAQAECKELLWFAERDLRMNIGTMPSVAGTAPITLSGGLILLLAEQIFLFLLRKAMFGENSFGLGVGACTLDVRNATPCYGRPEQYRITLAMADLANFYGCGCVGHAGLSDAKVPSAEAGAQKMMGLMTSALAVGQISVSAGLLSMDEVCSPLQLVIDRDLMNALNSLFAEPDMSDAKQSLTEILQLGSGGNHLGTAFTVDRCRDDVWHPQTWSASLLANWDASGKNTDLDTAREIWLDFLKEYQAETCISAEEEQELLQIIHSSRKL